MIGEYVAVDLGAGSGRVMLGSFGDENLSLREIHRFPNTPRKVDGFERWDIAALFKGVKDGLAKLPDGGRAVSSIGVDTWGVDFGLVDSDDRLIADPVVYRDPRTEGMMELVDGLISREELFARTGLQFICINTIYQLLAQVRAGEWPEDAAKLLFIPGLFNMLLCGSTKAEFTFASTSAMLKAGSAEWDVDLLDRLGLPTSILPELVLPGTELGRLKPELQSELGLTDLRVIAPACHDTASAVAGAPLEEGWAYISSGTWSLVGVERATPVLGEAAMAAGLTNEGGVEGTTRVLRNIMGLWILESCRAEWDRRGELIGYEDLQRNLDGLSVGSMRINPDDPRFFNPESMIAEVQSFLGETGQACPEDQLILSGIILESLADRYAEVIRCIEEVTRTPIKGIRIIGGGSQNAYLNQATANAAGVPVAAGPVEATALGNLMVQAIADGRFTDIAAARQFTAERMESRLFQPR